MCTNNLLTIEQFGFRTGHSTELTAIQLVDHLTKHTVNHYYCKLLNVLKVSDLFVCSIWEFYYKLTKKELTPYFNIMLLTLPNVCDYYIRRPVKLFHLLSIALLNKD